MNRKMEQQSISLLLGAICKVRRDLANEALAKIGVYAGQEMCLWHLWQQDGLTQSQMVERMCVQPPTISKMLDRMEKSGLVTRRSEPDESRVSRVHLTELGRSLAPAVRDIWIDLEQQLTHDLSVEERILLRRLLLQVQANLTAAPHTVERAEEARDAN